MEIIEVQYNHLMDLIEEAKAANMDHIATNDQLSAELLELLMNNGYSYEIIDRDNEVKGYLIRWK